MRPLVAILDNVIRQLHLHTWLWATVPDLKVRRVWTCAKLCCKSPENAANAASIIESAIKSFQWGNNFVINNLHNRLITIQTFHRHVAVIMWKMQLCKIYYNIWNVQWIQLEAFLSCLLAELSFIPNHNMNTFISPYFISPAGRYMKGLQAGICVEEDQRKVKKSAVY